MLRFRQFNHTHQVHVVSVNEQDITITVKYTNSLTVPGVAGLAAKLLQLLQF